MSHRSDSKKISYFTVALVWVLLSITTYVEAKNVTISVKNSTLQNFLQKIEKEADCHFSYLDSDLPTVTNFTITIKNKPVEVVLKQVFEPYNLTFSRSGQNFIIKKKPEEVSTVSKQSVKITGTVKDINGEAIIGASVYLKGSSAGTITDTNGHFEINAYFNAILQFSYIGMKTQEVSVKNSNFNVILQNEAIGMNEVVVVGYGTQKKVNLTGSVSFIGSDKLERRPILSTSASIQGISPGVTVTTQSGAPGADGGDIRIRGINSFGGSDCSPLVLIDGVSGNIDMVDANLIESISILKDAASAAIYGSRAANGVILITTKRASANKLSVNYKGYVGKQEATDIPKVTDGLTFMKLFNEANMNDNGYTLYSDQAIEEFKEKYQANPENYDWQKALLNGSGFTQNHFLSLTAISDKIQAMPSISYSSQDGIINNTGFKRFVLRNNMDIKPNDKIAIKFDMSFNNSDRLQIADESTVWNYLGRMPTNIPIKRNGLWSEGWVNNNPVAFIEDGGNKKTNNIELMGNLSVDIKPLPWLTLSGMIAPRYRTRNTHLFRKSVMTYNDDGSQAGAANTYTSLTETAYRYYFENYQFHFSTLNKWKGHTFRTMVGTSRETYDEKYMMAFRRDYTYDTYEVLSAGANDATKDNDGTQAQWALASAFGRFNYDFKNRYLFEANFRYDGSSRFIGANRWASFPSFSAGWRISEEPFMQFTNKYINQLKLRGSWGKLGNQNIGNSYYPFAQSLSMGSISMNDQIYPIITLNTMSNPDLKWEETTMTGAGVDLNLFDHFSLTFDWYKKNTDGILLTLYTSQLTGLNAPYQNAAKVQNKGYDLSVNYENKWGDFNLGIGVNISDVKNKITDLHGQTSGTLLRQQQGYAINSIYGYIAEGLYQSQDEIDNGPTQFGTLHPGDIKYKDIAGTFDDKGNSIPDGKITDADKVIIGNTIPRYTYGINLDLGWKGLKLNAFLQGVGKVDGYLNSHYVIPCINSSAIKTWQLDYWTEDNKDAAFPRLSITTTNNIQNSTFWMKSAAYLRLKNIQLGYEIPRKFLEKIGIHNLYIYADAQNLLTATNFWKGYDPEVMYDSSATDGVSLGSAAYYPQVKVYSLGIDIKF